MLKKRLLLALAITVVGDVSTFAEIKTYRVELGDTLWSIARESGVSFDALLGLNGISIEDPNWDRINAGDVLLVKDDRIKFVGTPYDAVPENAKLLFESGKFALFSGETAEDSAHNKTCALDPHNSLFLQRRMSDGKTEWCLVLTSGSDWKEAGGMSEWGRRWAPDVRRDLNIVKACLTRDRRTIWMVCSPPCSFWYDVVCRFDLHENTLAVLMDGFSAEEQSDGTFLIKNKKTYLSDENGEPLGARWYDVWITTDGKIVKKGKLKTLEETD